MKLCWRFLLLYKITPQSFTKLFSIFETKIYFLCYFHRIQELIRNTENEKTLLMNF